MMSPPLLLLLAFGWCTLCVHDSSSTNLTSIPNENVTSEYDGTSDETAASKETKEEQPCHDALSLPLPNASLRPDNGLDHDGLVYPQGTYWKAEDSYFGCPCEVTRCIRKCGDAEAENKLQLEILHEDETKIVDAYTHFKVVNGVTCEEKYHLDPHNFEEDNFSILSNGTLWMPSDGLYQVADFCLQMTSNSTFVVAVCFNDDMIPIPSKNMKNYVYPWFMLISVVFLLATIMAYANTPEIRTLHGRCVVCHSLSMIFGYIGLAAVQMEGQAMSGDVCRAIAFFTYYALLATFFWLNVMCFDIWWTFSGSFRQKISGSMKQTRLKKFLTYSSYSWGVPFILTMITLAVENLGDVQNKLRPAFGKESCWFHDFWTEFLYFYGPVSVILILNTFFFTATTVIILRLKRETAAMLEHGGNRKHNNTESRKGELRYKLYLKLFLVMGLSWVFEVLSFAIGDPEEIWYITDVFNTLQGVFIFLFCVWYTKVRDDVLRKFFPKLARKFSRQSSTKSVMSSTYVSEGISMKTVDENPVDGSDIAR